MTMKLPLVVLLLLSVLWPGSFAHAHDSDPMVITYRAPEDISDPRYEYDTELLRLALEKTVKEYGPFEMVPSPEMNFRRAIKELRDNTLPNFFVKLAYESDLVDGTLDFVRFPVDLGIVGYRIFFCSRAVKRRLVTVHTLKQLKGFSMIQGQGWSDVSLLRAAGFQVLATGPYESLFRMVANQRKDLFPRGINELLSEYLAYGNTPNLTYDEHLCLYYPLPRFLYTHAANQKGLERVRTGVFRAWEDGSLKELWLKYYGKSVAFAHLEKRTVFKIPNPNLKGLDFDYEQYFIDPKNPLN